MILVWGVRCIHPREETAQESSSTRNVNCAVGIHIPFTVYSDSTLWGGQVSNPYIHKSLRDTLLRSGVIKQHKLSLWFLLPGHKENKPVKAISADIRDLGEVVAAVKGVDAVIHSAGVVSYGLFPDQDEMEAVNVQGEWP